MNPLHDALYQGAVRLDLIANLGNEDPNGRPIHTTVSSAFTYDQADSLLSEFERLQANGHSPRVIAVHETYTPVSL